MADASSKLELDCWAIGYIFCRQAEIGFSLNEGFDTEFRTLPKKVVAVKALAL